jgi:site-specific recombinase XerD
LVQRRPPAVQNGRTLPRVVAQRARRPIDSQRAGRSFTAFRQRAGLPPELSLHALRHSYTTHLLEAGYDPLFVQQQLGHSYASTTSLYTNPRELRLMGAFPHVAC